MRMKSGHLKLTGYRLPTEAEWEYACRASSQTARYFGRGEELLGRYGWYSKNSEERAWPVGKLRPNELGLFDSLGNVWEWCEDAAFPYATSRTEDAEDNNHLQVVEQENHILRGGSFFYPPVYLRSANRNHYRPGLSNFNRGFRPARTLAE
ncbi:MAG: formylglycine-generating enzyme family protein [Gemmataceae bacterium]